MLNDNGFLSKTKYINCPQSMIAAKLLLLALCVQGVSAAVGTIFDLPTFAESDDVEFYYLEAPFPYNVPSNIL